MDGLNILSYAQYANDRAVHDGAELFRAAAAEADPLRACYAAIGLNDPKFFKMDGLSKLVLLTAEPLLRTLLALPGVERERVGLVLGSRHGSAEVDERFWQSTREVASPALFVYTLPNIALGELSIRHGLHGPSTTLLAERPDAKRLGFAAQQLIMRHGCTHVVCGWADIFAGQRSATLFSTGHARGTPWDHRHVQALLDVQPH